VSLHRLPKEAIKKLKNWQLHVLVTDEAVLGLFVDGLEYGDPDSGSKFSSPSAAFFQALRMCGHEHRKLRKAYERFCSKQRGSDSADCGGGAEGERED